jgi:hypothetical protein
MDEFARAAFREQEARRIRRRRAFWLHFAVWAATNIFLVVVWALTGAGFPWFLFPLFGWAIGLVAHGVAAFGLADVNDIVLQREQQRMVQSDTPPSSE